MSARKTTADFLASGLIDSRLRSATNLRDRAAVLREGFGAQPWDWFMFALMAQTETLAARELWLVSQAYRAERAS